MFSIYPSKIENGAVRENVKRMNILRTAGHKIILPFGTVEIIRKLTVESFFGILAMLLKTVEDTVRRDK